MDAVHEAHLQRILQGRRRRGALGVYTPTHTPHKNGRRGSSTTGTQTQADLPAASRGVQTPREMFKQDGSGAAHNVTGYLSDTVFPQNGSATPPPTAEPLPRSGKAMPATADMVSASDISPVRRAHNLDGTDLSFTNNPMSSTLLFNQPTRPFFDPVPSPMPSWHSPHLDDKLWHSPTPRQPSSSLFLGDWRQSLPLAPARTFSLPEQPITSSTSVRFTSPARVPRLTYSPRPLSRSPPRLASPAARSHVRSYNWGLRSPSTHAWASQQPGYYGSTFRPFASSGDYVSGNGGGAFGATYSERQPWHWHGAANNAVEPLPPPPPPPPPRRSVPDDILWTDRHPDDDDEDAPQRAQRSHRGQRSRRGERRKRTSSEGRATGSGRHHRASPGAAPPPLPPPLAEEEAGRRGRRAKSRSRKGSERDAEPMPFPPNTTVGRKAEGIIYVPSAQAPVRAAQHRSRRSQRAGRRPSQELGPPAGSAAVTPRPVHPGLPDVRSTMDLRTSTQIVLAGDWFYKWREDGLAVQPRWVWVDTRSYLLVWSRRETHDPSFCGSIPLECVYQITPRELVQADGEGMPIAYYVLVLETTRRVLQLATEKKEKADVWFEALNNVIAFVRRHDVYKAALIAD